jgi:formamidopyrimidine-DNA glycosylase
MTSIVVDPLCGDRDQLGMLVGAKVTRVRRHGKHVLVDTTKGALGMHFGMTGRLIVDGAAAIEELEYGARGDDPAWDRLIVRFDDGEMRVSDPRRFSRHRIDPVLDLGVDLLAPVGEIAAALDGVARRRGPVKGVLLDQRVIAGLGNLCVDEVLFHAGVDPLTPMREVADRDALAEVIGEMMPSMLTAGGSHTGDTGPGHREGDGRCALDGTPLVRSTVAGRATVSCPMHQR